MNALITSIGREEEYRENLLSTLEGYNIKANKNDSIKNLERLVEKQRKK